MWDAALSQKSKDGRFERSHFSRIQPSCRRKQRKQSLTQKGLENKNPLYRSRHTALIRLKGGGIISPMMLCKSDTRASVQVLGFPNADTVRFLSSFFMLDEHWTASMEPTASLWHTNRTMISNLLVVCFFVFVCVCCTNLKASTLSWRISLEFRPQMKRFSATISAAPILCTVRLLYLATLFHTDVI